MLSSAEFRERFRRASGRGNQQFEHFDLTSLRQAGVDTNVAEFLVSSGLPSQIALVGTFGQFDPEEIDTWRLSGMPTQRHPIGRNGLLSFIAIEPTTGRIFSISTDWRREHLVNSSMPQFAECLCLIAERTDGEDWATFLELIAQIDAPAAQPECFWPELFSDLEALDDWST